MLDRTVAIIHMEISICVKSKPMQDADQNGSSGSERIRSKWLSRTTDTTHTNDAAHNHIKGGHLFIMKARNRKHLFAGVIVCTTLCAVAVTHGDERVDAAKGVAQRLLGDESPPIQWVVMDAAENGCDQYETVCKNGTLTIKGSSTVALCRGLHDYLRANQLGMVGWEGPRITIPNKWPDAPRTQVESPCRLRHCYNVVTAGYTFPYWTWERWEQELDWLAMHGYNMIMAPVATEAIATRVWKKMGFTQKEIDRFYVGPAHLPWQRMGNIQNIGGTLPKDWHRDQVALQHKLLKRMRELGIEPVVQSFAGFVPDSIKRLHPEAETIETLWNNGFHKQQRPQLLLPDHPLYQTISQAYIKEWRKEFGHAKYYLVDSFNELKNINPDPAKFAEFGEKTLAAIHAGDPDAIWVIQGWIFSYQRGIWTKENVKSLFSKVPSDRVLILDYANDYRRGWDHFEGFYGKPYLMGYVPNMGGKTAYTGYFDRYAKGVSQMINSTYSGSCSGFTLSGEGLENNQALYELLSDTAWSSKAIELDQWVPDYCAARYGSCPTSVKKAWSLYLKTCYGSFTPHPRFGWQQMKCGHGRVNRDPRFVEGVISFLSARKELGHSASYQDDALEMTAIALGLKADEWFVRARELNNSNDTERFEQAAQRGLEILLEIDRLLESHSLLRLDRWIELARQHSKDEKLNDFYEKNARRIITVWGPPVNDYSARVWSGLIRDFYMPRMKAYLGGMKGEKFNRHAWEDNWVNSTGISKIKPYANPVEMASELLIKAWSEKLPQPEQEDVIGQWMPSQMSTKWKTLEWKLNPELLKELYGVKFIYTKGNHRLEIQSIALIADGDRVAVEKHRGFAGNQHKDNIYQIKVPEDITANNECTIRAVIRSNGGTDSFGEVKLIKK